VVTKVVTVTGPVAVTIGAGAAAPIVIGNGGSDGGTTTFGALVSAGGGGGGSGSATQGTRGTGGGGGGGGDGKAGGGQAGITTYPDRLYQVVEAGEPELYQQGGKTYLIPSSKGFGQVVPAINQSSVSGTTTPIKPANPNTPVASSSTITYNEGNISVVVNGGNASPQEIANAVQAKIEADRKQNQASVKDKLRTAAR
jgi:hypothetical protein